MCTKRKNDEGIDPMKNIAIVTGASSGLGREFVRQLCHSKVYIFDEIWIIARRKERLEAIAKKYKAYTFRIFSYDLALKEDLEDYKELLEEEKPNVKLLINNAGLGKIGKFDAISLDETMNMVDVNMSALTYLTYVTLKYMKKSSEIIQIASSAAFLPQPQFAVYAASKSYVLSFSRALHHELKPRGITVMAVCPGPIETEFFKVAAKNQVPKSFKKYFFEPVYRVVGRALLDVRTGKEVSVQGFSMKALRVLGKIVPHKWILSVMNRKSK